jgi:hypothetical protein
MPSFTNVKLTDMVISYGAAGRNVVQAQMLYPEQLPEMVVPN